MLCSHYDLMLLHSTLQEILESIMEVNGQVSQLLLLIVSLLTSSVLKPKHKYIPYYSVYVALHVKFLKWFFY